MSLFSYNSEKSKLDEKIHELQNLKKEISNIYEEIEENKNNTKEILDKIVRDEKRDLRETIDRFTIYRTEELEKLANKEQLIDKKQEVFNILYKEKTSGFPWLAKAFGEYVALIDSIKAKVLETKKRPAIKAAEVVKEVKDEKRALVKENKILKYIIEYYESMFPDLEKYKDEGIQEELNATRDLTNTIDDDSGDNIRQWLSEEEYINLTSIDKYQLALDRYKTKSKNNWQIGRDYERYIGYLYEKNGYKVTFHGITKGLDDMGIDLICTKDNKVELIQCKCWSEKKIIHEKHINQLYGTTVKYYIDNFGDKGLYTFYDALRSGQIVARFITSTNLSEKAKAFADTLGVIVDENIKLKEYPLIKCNINHETGEKIYHLPFDQQYDKVMIKDNGECYVNTVKEAVDLGFRRAFKWIQD